MEFTSTTCTELFALEECVTFLMDYYLLSLILEIGYFFCPKNILIPHCLIPTLPSISAHKIFARNFSGHIFISNLKATIFRKQMETNQKRWKHSVRTLLVMVDQWSSQRPLNENANSSDSSVDWRNRQCERKR